MVLVVTGKKVTFLVVTQKNVLVLVVTQKSALVLVVTKKNALVLVVILLLVVTEISLRRKKAYVVVTPISFVKTSSLWW